MESEEAIWGEIDAELRGMWPWPQQSKDLRRMLPRILSRMTGGAALERPRIARSPWKYALYSTFGVPLLIVKPHRSPIVLCYYACDLYVSWLAELGLVHPRVKDSLACLAVLLLLEWKFKKGAFHAYFLSWILPLEDWDFDGDLLSYPGVPESDRAKIVLVLAFASDPPSELASVPALLERSLAVLEEQRPAYLVDDYKRDIVHFMIPAVERLAEELEPSLL